MRMKASSNLKRSSLGTKGHLFCFSLLVGGYVSACSDAKMQDPAPQNDALYALPAGVNAEVNEQFQLGAQRLKGGQAANVSDKVTWVSSDENVVTVDSTGKATAKGIGTATVSTSYEGLNASVNVKVNGRIVSAEVEAAPIALAKGTFYKLATIGIVEDFSKRPLPLLASPSGPPAPAQTWGSSDPSVALMFPGDGTVIATGPGTATATLTFKNVTYPRNVTVLDVPLDSIAVTSDNGTTVPTTLKTTFRVVGSFGGGSHTQNITNLFAASVPVMDAEFVSTSGTSVTALALPKGATETAVVATIAGVKGTLTESFSQEIPLTIVDAKSLSSLAIANVPELVPVNGEPFTPTFKGTYGSVEVATTSPTLSFKGPTSDDKTKYVEIITGAVYPRIAGTATIVGTVSVPVVGQTEPMKVTASADVQIVDAVLSGVTVASDETAPTTTVGVDKTIKFKATAEYGTVTQRVTSAVVWVSADPTIALVSNASGAFGAPGRVTGVSPGTVEIQAYYRGKLAGKIEVTVIP
jgi:hypothetical protein